MNGMNIRLLQWSYPMLLWLMVAFFTVLACKNVVGSNEWNPGQPALLISDESAPTILISVAAR